MSAELFNLYLFAAAVGKAALLTGIAPGIALAFFGPRGAKFFRPIKIGKAYRIERHYRGDFIGIVEAVDRDVIRVRIVDTLRPSPRVLNPCAFPQCVGDDFHIGDHEFPSIREGALVQVWWNTAKFASIESESSSGGGQLATRIDSIPTLSNRATSPHRKIRGSA